MLLVLSVIGLGSALADEGAIPIFSDCSKSSVVTSVSSSTEVHVRYQLGGAAENCYAISAQIGGGEVHGFLLGSAHPSIQAFERESHSSVMIPVVAPVVPDAKPAVPEAVSGPESFAGFAAVDSRGRRIELDKMRAPYVVLYFWSAGDRKQIEESEALEQFYDQYHKRGIELIGVGVGPGQGVIPAYRRSVDAMWPLIHDAGQLAAQYKVDLKMPYFVLDAQRNVIGTAKRATDVLPVFQRQGKLPL
jgi:peroxiredoxin